MRGSLAGAPARGEAPFGPERGARPAGDRNVKRDAPSLASVIMPVLDAEEHIGDQLAALAGQTYRGDWEILVVDNGCRDRSVEVARLWQKRMPSLRIVDASGRRGLSRARNAGAAAARGDFLVFCDADDVVTPGWLEAMAAAAPTADIVGGLADLDALNRGLARRWCDWESPAGLDFDHGFLPFAAGGNCGIWRSVARTLRWDDSFMFGSTDMDFCWRAQLAGHELAFAPDAVIYQRLRSRLWSLARQFYSYGKSDPQLFRRFRDQGMSRPAPSENVGWPWILRRSPDLVRGTVKRGRWVRTAARACGRLVGSIRFRVLVP